MWVSAGCSVRPASGSVLLGLLPLSLLGRKPPHLWGGQRESSVKSSQKGRQQEQFKTWGEPPKSNERNLADLAPEGEAERFGYLGSVPKVRQLVESRAS